MPSGLFPDAPVIQKLPVGTDTVYAASVIRASRDLTAEYNLAKEKNVDAANSHIEESVASYNAYLEKRIEDCPKPEPQEKPKRRIWPFN